MSSASTQWLLVTDIDDTLLGGDDCDFQRLVESVEATEELSIVLNSSRPYESVMRTVREFPRGFSPDGFITAMGTEIWIEKPITEWSEAFGNWNRSIVDQIMADLGAKPHADEFQTPFKASFAVSAELQDRAREAIQAALPSQIIASGESDFDVLPPEAGKGAATLKVAEMFSIDPNRQLLVAGDSKNDLAMFEVCPRGILVGNARAELRDAVDPNRSYQASAPQAAGILEGLRHWVVKIHQP
ncbi:MAG: HAD-IIB family hydrolase [Verrucomicrobiota bacterium]